MDYSSIAAAGLSNNNLSPSPYVVMAESGSGGGTGAGPVIYHALRQGSCSSLDLCSSRKWREVDCRNDIRPGERSGAASVILNDSLYLLGGYGGNGRLDDLFRFDLINRVWSRVECGGQIPQGRENNGAVVHKGRIYIFGGYSGFSWLNDFHCFTFDSADKGTWSSPPTSNGSTALSTTPPSTRFGYVSAVCGNTLFIFGGYDGSAWLNDMYEYDFLSAEWHQTQINGFVPTGRSCPSWAVYNNSIYLFGGYDGVHRMNDFHQFFMGGGSSSSDGMTTSRTWSPVRSNGQAPSPRYFHTSVVYANSLFIFGGYSGHERLNDLYEYKFDNQTWTLLQTENPPSGRSSLVAQVWANSIFIFGGYNGSNVLNDFYEFRLEPVPIPPSTLVEDLKKLMTEDIFTDASFLLAGGKVMRANKYILAARSDHFKALFFGGMKEQKEAGQQVNLSHIEPDIFLLLLDYMHTDSVPRIGDISTDQAIQLLISAEMFLLDRLKALCEDTIRKNISISNSIQILLTAHAHRAEGLKDICMDFIINHEEEIKSLAPDSFRDLIQEPTLMYEVLIRRKIPSMIASPTSLSGLASIPPPRNTPSSSSMRPEQLQRLQSSQAAGPRPIIYQQRMAGGGLNNSRPQ